MLVLSLIAQVAAILLVVFVAMSDVRHFKIRNTVVLVLIALYLPAQGFLGFPDIWTDLAAGALLFVMGFVLWMMRGLGAGDVKLMFGLGLHLGWISLLPFAILLCLVSFVLYACIMIAHLLGARRGFGGWLAGLKATGSVPYGLVLAFASVPLMTARVLWLA